MEQRLSLVTLGVSNLGRSRAFYERLGWKPSTAGGEEVVFFQLGGIALALFPRTALAEDAMIHEIGSGFGGVALAHNVRSRAEVDSVLAEAAAAGAKILKAARAAPWGGYSGYFADLDGYPWEVAWNPQFHLGRDGGIKLPA